MTRRAGIVLAATLAAAAALASTAAARAPFDLSQIQSKAWPVRQFVISLPAGQRIEPAQVSVLENGQPVLRPFVQPERAFGTSGTVLVIDTSNSMEGAPIKAALAAARTFAAHLNLNQRLAVITFNNSNHLLMPFSRSPSRIERALSTTPGLAHGTNLYDAAGQAIATIQAALRLKTGSVVLLSDGGDTSSTLDLDQVKKLAQSAHVRVYTVGLRGSTYEPEALKEMAAATGGSYFEARSTKDLAAIFNQLGVKLANEYVVTYRSLVDPGRKVKVGVSIDGVGSDTTSYRAPKIPVPSYHHTTADRIWQSWVTMLCIALLLAAILGFGLLAVLRPGGSTVRQRLSDFVSTAKPEDDRDALATRLFDETERSLEEARWWRGFKESLELAEIRIPPVQILVGTLVVTLFAVWLLASLVSWVLAPAALLVPFGVRGWISSRVEKRRRAFADQLPDNLDVVASGLRAGHSIVGGLSLVVNDAPEPSRSEFQRVIADEQLGVPIEDALSEVGRRMKNRDIDQVALVASLQRESGGNSAEVLDRVTENIRERQGLRLLVRTLTAQGRLARWIVSLLPVGLLLVISLLNHEYIRPLFTHTSGRIMLAIGAAMIIAGSLVIKKIVDIKV